MAIGTATRDGHAVACMEVRDRGAGLSAEQAQRVFERFYRTDKARSRAHGGTGLGLSIVAAITAAHGGNVEVDTAPGDGATFRVLLPLAAPPAEPPDHPGSPEPSPSPHASAPG
jgi:two-component system OmpR family sensor kinase